MSEQPVQCRVVSSVFQGQRSEDVRRSGSVRAMQVSSVGDALERGRHPALLEINRNRFGVVDKKVVSGDAATGLFGAGEQLEKRADLLLDWGAQSPVLVAPTQPHRCLEVAEHVLQAIHLAKIPIPAAREAAMT